MSNLENKKNIEESKILIVVAGMGKGTVTGGEFEFRFVGWSLEKSFIVVPRSSSWILPRSMLPPAFEHICVKQPPLLQSLPSERKKQNKTGNISSIKAHRNDLPLTSQTCQNKATRPVTKI